MTASGAPRIVSSSRSLIGRDEQVVGEDDRAVDELWTVDGFEAPYGIGGAVGPMCGLIGELEEVHEPGGIILLLPCGVRALLVALRAGDARITDLAAPLPMTFAGVSRHIGVLESAGLVQRVIRGREHWLSIRPEGLGAAEDWISEQTALWSRRADALADRLARKEERQ